MAIIRRHGRWKASKLPRRLAPHRDPGLELVYVARGDVTWDYEGAPVRVPPRHVSYSWPWQEHGSATASLPACEIYWVMIGLAGWSRGRARLPAALGMRPTEERRTVRALQWDRPPVVRADRTVQHVFPELIDELERGGASDPARVRVLTQLLLVQVRRAAESLPPPTLPAPPGVERVRHFIDALPGHCQDPWTLEGMAEACGLARTRFADLVGDVTGETPTRLLNRLRVERARRMLADSKASVTDIAFACGFASSQYFATVFRQFTGTTPNAVRHGDERYNA